MRMRYLHQHVLMIPYIKPLSVISIYVSSMDLRYMQEWLTTLINSMKGLSF